MTPKESSRLPVDKSVMTSCSSRLDGLSAELSDGRGRVYVDGRGGVYVRRGCIHFKIPTTRLNLIYPSLRKIVYHEHQGLHSFEMGMHNRLGCNSIVRNLSVDILKGIARFLEHYENV